MMAPRTGLEVRIASRNKTWVTPTCGIAPGYLQANLIVLPSAFASDFEMLCARNPVPCPLLAKSATAGNSYNFVSDIPRISDRSIAAGIDVRTDAPRYNIYGDGRLVEEGITDALRYWDEKDHVAFLLGCSYSFEAALTQAGLAPPHILHVRNVPMYRTNIKLCPAGRFQEGTFVVSMRMFKEGDLEIVRDITRPYVATHGEPFDWGWSALRRLGIEDVAKPDWGDPPVSPDGQLVIMDDAEAEGPYIPVVWGCGVTPQEAVMRAAIPGVVIGHSPGHMVVLDVREEDVLRR